jgi:hypothetical protein
MSHLKVPGDANNTLPWGDGKIIGHYIKEGGGLKNLGTDMI